MPRFKIEITDEEYRIMYDIGIIKGYKNNSLIFIFRPHRKVTKQYLNEILLWIKNY